MISSFQQVQAKLLESLRFCTQIIHMDSSRLVIMIFHVRLLTIKKLLCSMIRQKQRGGLDCSVFPTSIQS